MIQRELRLTPFSLVSDLETIVIPPERISLSIETTDEIDATAAVDGPRTAEPQPLFPAGNRNGTIHTTDDNSEPSHPPALSQPTTPHVSKPSTPATIIATWEDDSRNTKDPLTPAKRKLSASAQSNKSKRRQAADTEKPAGYNGSQRRGRPKKQAAQTTDQAESPVQAQYPAPSRAPNQSPSRKILGGLSDCDLRQLQPGVSGRQAWLTGNVVNAFIKLVALILGVATFESIDPGSNNSLSEDIRTLAIANGAIVVVCFNSHWALAKISVNPREVFIWDSRRSKESDTVATEQVLFNAKRIVGGDTPVFESFASSTASNRAIKWETCPQQQSDYDWSFRPRCSGFSRGWL